MPDVSETYWKRYSKRVWSETTAVWNSYRWAISFASIASAAGSAAWLINKSVLEAVVAAVSAFLGSYVACIGVSIIRTPALIDSDREKQVSELQREFALLKTRTAGNKMDEALKTELARRLARMNSKEAIRVLRFLSIKGESASGGDLFRFAFAEQAPSLTQFNRFDDIIRELTRVDCELITCTEAEHRLFDDHFDIVHGFKPFIVEMLERFPW